MNFQKLQSRAHWVKQKSSEFGFFLCTVARAQYMDEEASRLDQWLIGGHHGEMAYMENHYDKRLDPTRLVPGAKSVISLAYNYFNPDVQTDPSAPKISMYAYGRDYHKVVRKKLEQFLEAIREEYGAVEGRVFVDSAPVLERDWARRSGLGWVGKNTMVIHPRQGSYFFLAELIIDLELAADHPLQDYCGTCTRCIDACPTDAISPEGYWMDGSKCISYLTIEYKEKLPETYRDKMADWMYGCDICQQVCPWNRFSTLHNEPEFLPKSELLSMTRSEWQDLTEPVYDTLFQGSAVKRAKYMGLRRNIDFLINEEK
jgi:epoxyqueuosine reductase